MATVTPNGKLLMVQSPQGSTTYIAALNPRVKSKFVAHIPESSPRTSFTVTDLLDGTVANEYLIYPCDHAVISSTVVAGKIVYTGAIVRPTGDNKQRFEVVKLLTHTDCVEVHSEKIGVSVSNWRYSDMANVSKSEEIRRATQVSIMENPALV